MSRRTRWIVGLLVVLLLAGGTVRVLQSRKARAAAAAVQATPAAQASVELAASDVLKLQPVALTQGLPVSGSLRAVNVAVVKARVAGELQGLTVREGDRVSAGQVLARIDPTESQARLRQAQQQADAAQAQIDIAQRAFDNNKALVDQGFISRTALDTSLHQLNAAKASWEAARAATDVARKSLDDTVLKAPISGLVSQRLAQTGERVAIDGRVLEIVDLSQLELEATLAASDSVQLRVGQSAALQVEGMAQPVAARVARINPSAQAGSRSVLAYLAVQGGEGLRQGLFAQGRVATADARVPAVPVSALRTDKPAPYLQLVRDGKVVHQAVTAGARGIADNEPWVAVEGVPDGAAVIRGHIPPLRDGTPVNFTAVKTSP